MWDLIGTVLGLWLLWLLVRSTTGGGRGSGRIVIRMRAPLGSRYPGLLRAVVLLAVVALVLSAPVTLIAWALGWRP
ncbi:hypothetical protein [Actinomadura hibisca]|uniref:hypothetical protein n=1 Tax=Actinomadura hibisca TaxID=68565 RepID=UPI000834D068|nr:hypothetical protein [Actinomadura hibisca]